MERFQELREAAKINIKNADHMVSVTYPLVKDTKLLLAIMENIFLGLNNTMSSLLYYDKLFKRIPSFGENFDSKFNLFRARCTRRYRIDEGYINLIQDVKSTIKEHKRSPVEFVKNDKFVICDNNYKMKTISVEELKEYIIKAKLFIEEINNITSKNEGLFG